MLRSVRRGSIPIGDFWSLKRRKGTAPLPYFARSTGGATREHGPSFLTPRLLNLSLFLCPTEEKFFTPIGTDGGGVTLNRI